MAFVQIAPIFLAAEITVLLALILMTLSQRGRVTARIAIALAILAGLGLVIFLLYAFPTAGLLAANLTEPWR
jgi:uncharacterized protein with PQ loop repeat